MTAPGRDDTTAAGEEVLLRPNGKPYRAKRPPRVSETEDYHSNDSGVIVEHTHNPDVAAPLAEPMWRSLGYDPPLPEPSRGWYRLAPRDGEFRWVEDPERGVPCLVYGAQS